MNKIELYKKYPIIRCNCAKHICKTCIDYHSSSGWGDMPDDKFWDFGLVLCPIKKNNITLTDFNNGATKLCDLKLNGRPVNCLHHNKGETE